MSDRLAKLMKGQIYDFFEELYRTCKKKGTYSVIETAEVMGVPYSQVTQWASSNEDWDAALRMCRNCCFCNAEHAWICGNINEKDGLKYCIENESEFH